MVTIGLRLAPWSLLLAGLWLLGGQARGETETKPIQLVIKLPADAELSIDGQKTTQTGTQRTFESPPVPVGKTYSYQIKAVWKKDGMRVVREQKFQVAPGKVNELDLLGNAPADKATKTKLGLTGKHELGKLGMRFVISNLGGADEEVDVTVKTPPDHTKKDKHYELVPIAPQPGGMATVTGGKVAAQGISTILSGGTPTPAKMVQVMVYPNQTGPSPLFPPDPNATPAMPTPSGMNMGAWGSINVGNAMAGITNSIAVWETYDGTNYTVVTVYQFTGK
jgi:uncharacterized protein (TIGR03000 family)